MKKSGNNTIRRTIRSTSPRVVDDTIGPSLVHRPNERTPGRHILGTSAPGRGRKRIHDEMEKSGRRTGFVQSLSEHNHQHRCKICGSCFDRVNQLKSHLIEHGSDRPFPCFVCNVRFTTKWNLMKHQKCRAHRVVQSKTSEESVNEKSRAGRQILPKRRKLARLSPGPVCQIGPSITQQNDASPTSDNLTIRTIQLEVIPFSSPIAAQIQTIQLNHISSDVKPFTRIRGTLSLELPDNRTINLSVRMRYEQLTECLLPSCRQPTTDRLRIPNVPSSDNTLSLDKELDKNDPPHPTSLPNLSESYFNSIRQASNPCELLQTVKSISSSRTQEEIQAAKTILSLAQSAQRQSPLISCSNEETDLPYTLKSMEGLDSQLEAGQSGSVSMVQSKEDTTKSLKANITNSVSLQQGQQPVTLAFNPIDAAPLPLSQTTRIVESTGSSLKSPAPLSPKQGTSSWIPICPPPKKRISATYRQTGTNTCEIAEPNQRDKPIQPSAVASSACISNLLPTTVKQTSTTKNTSLSSVVTIASEPLTLSTQAPLSIPTVTPVVTHSDALSSAHTSLSMINSLSVSTVPTANPIPSVAPNLFILPQVMLLPRVISPYISVSHNPGVMAPCYVVHSDGGARLATTRSTTTPTAVVNGSVPVRLSTGSCPTTISLVSVTPSITTSPVNSVAASDNQSDNVCKTGLNASPGEKPTGTPPASATNSDSLLCSPRLIDSYAPHANHSLTGTNGLVSISVPFATSSDPGASNQPSSRANIPIRSSNSQARVLVCRNKYRCYECGVVCHKPCLLRKHYRTHSNVRPYVCRHCDVSFKTRGNLSKHMKSKGHYDRCIKELGMEKVPMIVDDKTQIDHQALERQRQLVLKRDHIKRSKYRAIRAANYPLRIRPAALPPGSSDASLSLRKLRRIRRGRQKITDSLVRNPTDSVTSTAQQSNFSAPRLTTTNGKIPAPNVNAVHLLQDLPLNLSVRPRQSATLSSSCLTDQSMPPTIPQDVANRPLTDPEEVVRTAVVAARIIHNGTVVNSESSKRVNSSQITPLIASKQRSDLVPTLSVPSPILPSPPRQAAIRCPIPSGPQSAFKAVKDQKPSPVPIPTRTPKPVTKASSLTPVSRSSTQLLLPRGDPPEVLNGKTLDPRPYKCATCRVGFRVTGHLHKHFRAKSHLLNELQANKWSAESIECVRLSRINVSQFVNPDNGHLRLKSVERFLAAKQMLPGKLLDPKETK